MECIKKIISTILIIILLMNALPFESIAKENADLRSSVRTIDLTDLVTGADTSHEHIYEKKYDNNKHWDECFICHNKTNEKLHSIITTNYSFGYKSCYPGNTYTRYCNDGCGYNVTTKDTCVAGDAIYNVDLRYLHHKSCKNCGVWMNSGGCVDSEGRRINCKNLGTCTICKHVYTKPIHHVTNNGACEFCGVQFVELLNSSVDYASDYSYAILRWTLKGKNGGVLTGEGGWYSPNPAESKTYTITKNEENKYTYEYKIVFNKSVQNVIGANFDSNSALKVNGDIVHFSGFGLDAYYDHIQPSSISITASGVGTIDGFSKKASITAKVRETASDIVQMRLLDKDRSTVLTDWGTATEESDVFTRVFDLATEVKESCTVYVQSKDRMGNEITQSVNIQYIDAKAPTLIKQEGNNENWTRSKEITYVVSDKASGAVQIAFNNQSDFQLADTGADEDTYTRKYNFIGDVYGTVTGALYLKDRIGNVRTEKVTISNIDNTAPTITNIIQNLSTDKKTTNITIQANDINTKLGKSGSGVAGYQITINNTEPTSYQTSNIFTIDKNGTYYVWVRDNVGNVKSQKIQVVNLEIDIGGTIAWNDQNNKYNSRVQETIKIYRKTETSIEELVQVIKIEAGQKSWMLKTRECDDAGNKYQFIVRSDAIPGYESKIDGKNIINNLILPNYTQDLVITSVNSFEDRYLKNGRVKIEGNIKQSEKDREKVGIHQGIVTLSIDQNIQVDERTIRITSGGVEQEYNIKDNIITIQVAETIANYEITIYLEGTIKQIEQFHNEIQCEGKLKSYVGEKTSINLGQVAKKIKEFKVEYQVPEANIKIIKRDSITKENLTDAKFTLYEWNGEKYKPVENIIDDDKDGIYISKYYSWNYITQGKYKVVETGFPEYHKDLGFCMGYQINQLKTDNYTVTVDYDNSDYKIEYKERNPDEYIQENGVVENEPWKVKVKIENIDKETQNNIRSNAEYTIYEWNKDTKVYEESKITFKKQEDFSYLSSNWLYYTKKNEGKYRVIQTKAADGYYGDYDKSKEKRIYSIDLIDWIEMEDGTNEGIIQIKNAEKFESIRTKGTIDLKIVDSQTKGNAQANATLKGAKYGLYAFEPIYHSDGKTTRYDEDGLLYKQDELIQEKEIEVEGKTVWENLECGKYYIKMIQAPEGYKLDETKYEIEIKYENESEIHIYAEQKIEVQVKKQAFQLKKVQEDSKPLPNAGFSIYQINELTIVKEGKIERKTASNYELKDVKAKEDRNLTKKVNEDGTYALTDLINYYYKIQQDEEDTVEISGNEQVYYPYKLDKEIKVINYEKSPEGENIEELITDENGYLKSPKLAYGEYIVIETSVPRSQDSAEPFVVEIQEDSEEPQDLRIIIDKNFRSKIKLYVKDKSTNEDIINNHSEYVIRNAKTRELQTNIVKEGDKSIKYGTIENPFIVGETGNLVIPIKLEVGEYIIEQVTAPIGYAKNWNKMMVQENIIVNIRSNTAYYVDKETGDYVTVVNQMNEPTKVKIKTIDKETKKVVTGIKLKIQDEEGKTILNSSEEQSKKGEYLIQRLPVGKLKVIETQIPYERGYVVKQENELIVKDNGQWQGLEIEQELSKIRIEVIDKETRKSLNNVQIQIRKKDSQEIVATTEKDKVAKCKEIEKKEGRYIIKGLPVGKYRIIEKVPDGYKQIEEKKLIVKDTAEWQDKVIENRKLRFSMKINKKIEWIKMNGKAVNIKNTKLPKVEIRAKKIKTQNLQIQYVINVKNIGEVEGTIGTIEDIMPTGFKYIEKETGIWQIKNKVAICDKYKDEKLKPGESKQVRITLKWKNSVANFGEKVNKVYLKGSTNKYNYPNTQAEKSKASMIIGIRTGKEDIQKIAVISIIILVICAGILFLIKKVFPLYLEKIINEIIYTNRK